MKKSYLYKILAVCLSFTLLTACSNAGSGSSGSTEDNNSSTILEDSATSTGTASSTNKGTDPVTSIDVNDLVGFDDEDTYESWENQSPTYITLSETTVSIKGSGATAKGSELTISSSGVYVLSGKLTDGQLLVNTQDKDTVRLVLNGVTLASSNSAPIYIQKANKVIISLPDNTQNTLSDGKDYIRTDASSDEPSAALFSKSDLVINGNGSLTIKANYNDGITSKDELKITGGTLNITAADDGITGKDMIAISDGTITINAGGDGLKSTNDEDSTKGFIAITGGSFSVTAENDGIQALTNLYIAGGEFSLSTGGGSSNAIALIRDNALPRENLGETDAISGATTKSEGTNEPPTDIATIPNTSEVSSEVAESDSAKGLKASSSINISGGTITIDSKDDSIHSNGTIEITDATISTNSGDDGIHADSSIIINDGLLDIAKSYEGIESSVVTINGGDISVVASDDGINIAGGADGSSVNGRLGQNDFAVNEDNNLYINNGSITVNADGDGLDSNGNITMTGGTVLVNGPTNDGNGALDYQGTFAISGGTLIAAGSSGMAQAPSETSTQGSIAMYYTLAQQAGTVVTLKDSKGNELVSFKPEKDFQSVVISTPDITIGSSYTHSTGDISVDFTNETLVTWLSESGITTQNSDGFGRNNGGFPEGGSLGKTPGTRPNGKPGQAPNENFSSDDAN